MFNIGDEVRIKTTGTRGVIINKIEHDNRNDYLVRVNNQEFWYLENILELATISKMETAPKFKIGDEVSYGGLYHHVGKIAQVIENNNEIFYVINTTIGTKVVASENQIKLVSEIEKNIQFIAKNKDLKLSEVASELKKAIQDTPIQPAPTDYSIKSDLHEKICKELNSIYKAKNADYSDSFSKVRQIVPNAILVRLNDKIQRLNKLMTTGEHNVKSESIRDTLLDLANYAILEIIEMEGEK